MYMLVGMETSFRASITLNYWLLFTASHFSQPWLWIDFPDLFLFPIPCCSDYIAFCLCSFLLLTSFLLSFQGWPSFFLANCLVSLWLCRLGLTHLDYREMRFFFTLYFSYNKNYQKHLDDSFFSPLTLNKNGVLWILISKYLWSSSLFLCYISCFPNFRPSSLIM